MKLARREIITIAVGGTIAVAALGYRLSRGSNGPAGLGEATTIGGALARLHEHERASREVERLRRELSLTLPGGTAGEQESRMREEISALARRHDLAFSSLRRADAPSRRAADVPEAVQFRLEVSGRFEAIMAFTYSLENAATPYVVKEVQFEATAARRGFGGRFGGPVGGLPGAAPAQPETPATEGAAPTGQGIVRATYKIQGYLFPAPPQAGTAQAGPRRETPPTPERTQEPDSRAS